MAAILDFQTLGYISRLLKELICKPHHLVSQLLMRVQPEFLNWTCGTYTTTELKPRNNTVYVNTKHVRLYFSTLTQDEWTLGPFRVSIVCMYVYYNF